MTRIPSHFGSRAIEEDEIKFSTQHFVFLSQPQPILNHSGILIPKRYVTTPFDLTEEEWADLRHALIRARSQIEENCTPDGYNIGWNVGIVAGQEVDHLHLHIIPRFADEPMAGKGIRAHIKTEQNKRPVEGSTAVYK